MVACPVELVRGGESPGSAPHDGDLPAGARGRRKGYDPPLFEGPIDDGPFDPLDRHRGIRDPENAGVFAGSGADTPGPFGEIVGPGQALVGFPPPAAEDQVVPLGDQVVDRTPRIGLTEGDAAVHAARPLIPELGFRFLPVDLPEVLQPLPRVPLGNALALVLQEAPVLFHRMAPHARGRERDPAPTGTA